MDETDAYTGKDARNLAIEALTFLTGDAAMLERFLKVTGWSPPMLSAPDSQEAIIVSALDYLMSEEDLLLTFTANSGYQSGDVVRAHRILLGGPAPEDERP